MMMSLVLALAACGQSPAGSTAATAPTIDPNGTDPQISCTVMNENTPIKWNGVEHDSTVALCSDQCLHFSRNDQGFWNNDITVNCTAATWPSNAWNGDAYEKPTAPQTGCYSIFCNQRSGW